MTDSDNSRTLPVVTRRQLLCTLAAWLAAQTSSADQERVEEGETAGDDDPVLALWQQWMAAHEEVERLCEAQQRLESQMMRHVGFPQVEIALTNDEAPVPAFSMEEIDLLLGDGPERAEIRATAKSTLAKRQRKWNKLDQKLGFSRAKKAEAGAFAMRDDRANALWAEPPRSLAGVAAKLHVILCMGREDCPDDEFPWPQISAAVMDIVAIGGGDR